MASNAFNVLNVLNVLDDLNATQTLSLHLRCIRETER